LAAEDDRPVERQATTIFSAIGLAAKAFNVLTFLKTRRASPFLDGK
jgi:hypothetical protein